MACEICEGKGWFSDICGTCNGSGEGRYDGSVCYACHGKGEVKIECDCEEEEIEDDEEDRD